MRRKIRACDIRDNAHVRRMISHAEFHISLSFLLSLPPIFPLPLSDGAREVGRQ
jgi:hypothetical protein